MPVVSEVNKSLPQGAVRSQYKTRDVRNFMGIAGLGDDVSMDPSPSYGVLAPGAAPDSGVLLPQFQLDAAPTLFANEPTPFKGDQNSLTAYLTNNYVPTEVWAWLADRVLAVEVEVSALFNNIQLITTTPELKSAIPQSTLDALWTTYHQGWLAHNVMKFWCLLVPTMRDRIGGKVKPPSIDQIKSAPAAGLHIPGEADIAAFVAQHADSVPGLIQSGYFMNGLSKLNGLGQVKLRGYTTQRTREIGAVGGVSGTKLGRLGAVDLVPIAIAAGAIAAFYFAWKITTDALYTARRKSSDQVTQAFIAAGRADLATKAQKDATDAEHLHAEDGALNDPLAMLTGAIPWVVGGIAVIYLAPGLISLFKRFTSRNFATESALAGLGCGPDGSCTSCARKRGGLFGT